MQRENENKRGVLIHIHGCSEELNSLIAVDLKKNNVNTVRLSDIHLNLRWQKSSAISIKSLAALFQVSTDIDYNLKTTLAVNKITENNP